MKQVQGSVFRLLFGWSPAPVAVLILMGLVQGCAGGAPHHRSAGGSATTKPEVSVNVDASKAYLSLEQIDPPINHPIPTEEIKPLSQRSIDQVAKARKLTREQRYTEAALEVERALRYDPNHPEIQSVLAALHWQAGNVQRAHIHADRALELNADNGEAHYILGRIAAMDSDEETALKQFRIARLCSDFGKNAALSAGIAYHLAESLRDSGYLTAALDAYEAFEQAAHELDPSEITEAELRRLLKSTSGAAALPKSEILEQLGRFGEAAKVVEPLLKKEDGGPELAIRHGRLLFRAGRLDDALAAVRSIESCDQGVLDLLGEIHQALGHPEAFLTDLRARGKNHPDDDHLILAEAGALIRSKREQQAVERLNEFLDRYPQALNALKVRLYLIDALMKQQSWDCVLAVGAEGIVRQPDDAEAVEQKIALLAKNRAACDIFLARDPGAQSVIEDYLCGFLALEADRDELAEAFLRAARTKDPDFLPARLALAKFYFRNYQYEEALKAAGRKDADLPEDARLEALQGEIHERLDDEESAQKHFQAAIQLNHSDFDSMVSLSDIYRRRGDNLSAQRQLRIILEQEPNHAEARELLILNYMSEGKLDAVSEQIEKLRQYSQSPLAKVRSQALLEFIHSRDAGAYRQALLDALKEHPADDATWLAIADTYDEFEQAQARDAYLKALELSPDDEAAMLGVIFASERLLDYEGALERFQKLALRCPNRDSWWLGWGGGTWRLGILELQRAVQDHESTLESAIERASRSNLDEDSRRRYRLAILGALRRLGRLDEMENKMKSWIELEREGDHSFWSVQLAREYLRRERPDEAMVILEAATQADPGDRALVVDFINVLSQAKRYDCAAQLVLDPLADDPLRDELLQQLLIVLAQAERYDDGYELIKNRLLTTRDRERFQDMWLSLLALEDQHIQAEELAESLLEELVKVFHQTQDSDDSVNLDGLSLEQLRLTPNQPFSPEVLDQRALTLRSILVQQLIEAEEYRDAENRLSEWLDNAQDPRSRFRFLFLLAQCHRFSGREEAATSDLEQALALQPDHVGLNNDVAYGWIDRGVRLDRAERMIRFSVSREPWQMAYLDTLGWLMYKKGQFEEAHKWIARAKGTQEDMDPVVLDHMGDVLWCLGRSKEAIESWVVGLEEAKKREAEEFRSTDEHRVLETTQQKIDDATAGREPKVAPFGSEDSANDPNDSTEETRD